jgi:urease accessory protein
MKRLLLAFCLIPLATPAFAHLPPGEYGSFAAGFSHPLFGLDHILAMVAVGLWASVLGKRALWIVPSTFVSIMLVGFVLALLQVPLPFVEPMILASTIVLGLVVAMAVRLDVRLCAGLVGLFALFHGHAHGGELAEAGAAQFGLGFVLATALLHGVGVGLGLLVARIGQRVGTSGDVVSRGLGAFTALAGVAIAIG